MDVHELPRIDEHSLAVQAPPDAVWDAAVLVFRGTKVPGFRVVEAERPARLVLAGRHWFSRYAIVIRVESEPGGSRCRLESRAAFPGPHGSLYRLAVVSSGGHAFAVRRLLRQIARTATVAPP